MAAAYSNLARLPAAARQQIEAWLADFAEFWHEDYLAVRVRALPPSGDPIRLPAMLEMVKIDLKRQWQRGRQATVEMYLAQYPELGAPDTVHASLVLAEHEMRVQAGATQDLPHLAQRFPKQAAKLLIPFRQPVLEATVEPRPSTQAPALAPAAAPTLPPQFGRYRIVRRLGLGGMGAVYLAHDTQLDRAVALKVPHISTEDGPGLLKRFHREARAAAALEHPNLCRIYDVGTQDDVPYLTMAYVEGPTLAHVIKGGTLLPQHEAAGVVQKLALAMVEAHAKGIIHRDLKPANVMIAQRGEPVIMDFGLAKQSNGTDTRVTRLGAMMGTPSYMPPEQVRGQADAMGPGCDIYSLGVILYQLLTGHVPFEGPMDVVLGQILTQPPPPPSSYRPDLDPLLEAICLRALQKEIASRHASMAELAEALTSWLGASTAPVAAARPLQPTTVESLAQAVARAHPMQPPMVEAPALPVVVARPLQPTMIEAPAPPVAAARPLQPTLIETPTQSPDRSVSVSGKGKRVPTAAERQRLGEVRSAKAKKNLATPEPNAEGQQGADARRTGRYARQKSIGMMSAESQELADAHSAGGKPEAGRVPFGTPERWVAGVGAVLLLVFGIVALMRGGGPVVQPAPVGNEAVRSNAMLAADFVNRGIICYANKQYDEAFNSYNEAIRLDGNNAVAFNGRGLVWYVKQQNEEAFKDYNEAIRLNPTLAIAFNNRGLVWYSKQRYDEAFRDYNEAIRLDPRLANPYTNRGLVWHVKNQNDQALKDCNEAIRLEPNAWAFNVRGLVRSATNQHDQALKDFDEAVRLDPDNAAFTNNRRMAQEKQVAAKQPPQQQPPPQQPPPFPAAIADALIREMKFVHVPKGTFWMGWDSEKKQSEQVTIAQDFELAAYTVTQAQWEAVMGNNPSHFSRHGGGKEVVKNFSDGDLKRFPVEQVSWDDVQIFLKKLNEHEQGKGWKYRLPREAEWEYACRGGAASKEECSFDFYFAKGTNDLSWDQANFYSEFPAGNGAKGKSLGRTTKVGQYAPNKLGLYDMQGNVWQWCEGLWGSDRVFRGGCWLSPGQSCRAADRNWFAPSLRSSYLGFRVSRVPSSG